MDKDDRTPDDIGARAPVGSDIAPARVGNSPGDEPTDEPGDLDLGVVRLAQWQQRFVKALALVPSVKGACEAANVSRETANKHRESDAAFRDCWDNALAGCWDAAEGALYDEGVNGRVKVTTKKDGTVIEERVRDVRALEIVLRAKRPKEFREQAGGVTINLGSVDQAIEDAVNSGLLAEFAARKLTAVHAQLIDSERVT